jgi:hypothetical protein
MELLRVETGSRPLEARGLPGTVLIAIGIDPVEEC